MLSAIVSFAVGNCYASQPTQSSTMISEEIGNPLYKQKEKK